MFTSWPLQVFYDGACPLCSREAARFRSLDRAGRIQWIDISKSEFSAPEYQLDPLLIQQVMHARQADGQVFTQLAAFMKIWEALPPRPLKTFLLGFLKIPGILPLANILYRFFARNRHRLTGRCTPETCETNR